MCKLDSMRAGALWLLALSLICGGCSSRPDERTFTLQGQVLAIDREHRQATIRHEEIKGLMPAMTMPYTVKEVGLLDGIKPGDLITATLAVVSNDAYLTAVKKVGEAPLEKPPADQPTRLFGDETLKPGDSVPDGHFVDQNGRKRDFGAFKGSTLVVTFIYTKCPLPN